MNLLSGLRQEVQISAFLQVRQGFIHSRQIFSSFLYWPYPSGVSLHKQLPFKGCLSSSVHSIQKSILFSH